jgi:integrase
MGLAAWMYYAALRPGEVVGLRRQDCHLAKNGWGRLTPEKPARRATGAGPTPTPGTRSAD